MRALSCLLIASLLPLGQGQEFVIKVDTNLIIVNVDVRDKSGKPMTGLKASDFVLTEDGKPRKIAVFEYQQLEGDPVPTATAAIPAPSPTPLRREIQPSSPGQVRYRDKRLMVLFFDFSSMAIPEQVRAQESALKFIDTQLTPADMVSIMSFSTKLQVLEDFTADRERLREIVKGFGIGEGSDLAVEGVAADDENAVDTGDAFQADETEFNIFNTDRKLGALESAAKMLASLPEKKALVYFSSGAGKTGTENQSQLRATINAAVRANVAFYPVDARGLIASAPAGDASQGSPRGSGIFSGDTQRGQRDKVQNQQETLYSLASDTGGKALLDSNDLSLGIRQAQRDIASYYILGFYTGNAARDGRYRRVKVSLQSGPQAKLDYRSGYFAPKEFKNFTSDDKERQLEEALSLGDPLTDLPLALEVNWFRMSRSQYFVPVAVKIPGSALELARSGSKQQAELDFIGQVKDKQGRIAGVVRDEIKVKLAADNAGKLSQRNLSYDSGFTLEPGDYTLRFLARENVTGKMGTFETKFAVPDIAGESKWLRTSSVVWSNQRENMAAAVGGAEKNKKLLATHPLIRNNQKLVPSITRVYRKDQNLYVYLEAYDSGRQPGASVAASLTFFRGNRKAFDTEVVRVTEPESKRPSTIAVQLAVPLAKLQPGRYTCQLNVIDEAGGKFAFARAPLVLVGEERAASR